MKHSVAYSVEVAGHSLGVGADDVSFLHKPTVAFFAEKNSNEVSLGNGMAVVALAGFMDTEVAFTFYIDRSCIQSDGAGV